MEFITEIPALRSAVVAFCIMHGAGLAPYTRGYVETAAGYASPVDQFTAMAEILYAGIDDVDPASADAACTMTGQLAQFVLTNYQTLSMGEEPDRGLRIVAAMRRRLGETPGPDPSTDPLPLDQYKAP